MAHELDIQPDGLAEQPTNVRWGIFGLCCGTSWFLYLHRYTFGIIKPEIAKEWNLTEGDLGWLDFAFSFTYSLAQVPAGYLSDVLGAHLFLGVTIIGWSLALALHAMVPYYETLYPVRVLFGVMQAGCYPTLSKISKTWFPRSIRTILQGWIASFFGRMGGAMSNVIFASLLIGFLGDWRISIYILSVAGVVFGVVFALTYRNTPREHPGVNEAEAELIEGEDAFIREADRKSILPRDATNCPMCGAPVEPTDEKCGSCGESFRTVAAGKKLTFREMFAATTRRSRWNFFAFLVQQFTSTFADSIYVAWIPYFLSKEHGMDFKEMGIYASLPLFGGATGGAVGGFLNDWLILRMNRRWARTLVGFTGKLIACGLVFVALWSYDNPQAFCIILFFVKFFSDWSQPTVWGTCTDIGGKATATVFGFNNMVGGFGGNLSPVVFGYIAMLQGWTPVFTVVGLTYLLSSVSWLFVDCTIPIMREDFKSNDTT